MTLDKLPANTCCAAGCNEHGVDCIWAADIGIALIFCAAHKDPEQNFLLDLKKARKDQETNMAYVKEQARLFEESLSVEPKEKLH